MTIQTIVILTGLQLFMAVVQLITQSLLRAVYVGQTCQNLILVLKVQSIMITQLFAMQIGFQKVVLMATRMHLEDPVQHH